LPGNLIWERVQNANPVWTRAAAGAALLGLLWAGCGRSSAPEAAPPPKTVMDHFTIPVGGRPASLQVAILAREQERGLMQRTDLTGDEGMIFVNARPGPLTFWMKNTPEPLDIGYADPEGMIEEIYPLLPNDQRAVKSHSDRLQFAVEMRQGWYAANGVRPGAQVDLKALAAALKARGYEPARFGLP
jgi:uncharacterized membrane protein (UPF0127 family)